MYRGGDIVPLGHYSDITFLEWEHLAGDKTNGLQYIFRNNIINRQTKNAIFQALANSGVEDGPVAWPGHKFDMQSKEGKAILGTPNGNGIAWILFSHRAQLGWKTVKSVVVFENVLSAGFRQYFHTDSRPTLLFEIEDYQPATSVRARDLKRKRESPATP